jgi:hypothetical protein
LPLHCLADPYRHRCKPDLRSSSCCKYTACCYLLSRGRWLPADRDRRTKQSERNYSAALTAGSAQLSPTKTILRSSPSACMGTMVPQTHNPMHVLLATFVMFCSSRGANVGGNDANRNAHMLHDANNGWIRAQIQNAGVGFVISCIPAYRMQRGVTPPYPS